MLLIHHYLHRRLFSTCHALIIAVVYSSSNIVPSIIICLAIITESMMYGGDSAGTRKSANSSSINGSKAQTKRKGIVTGLSKNRPRKIIPKTTDFLRVLCNTTESRNSHLRTEGGNFTRDLHVIENLPHTTTYIATYHYLPYTTTCHIYYHYLSYLSSLLLLPTYYH